MPLDIDKYTNDDKEFKIKFPKIRFPKLKLPKLKSIKLNQNTTILLVVIIVVSAYIYVEKSKISYQEEIRQEEIKQEELDKCLAYAFDNYNYNLNKACKSRKLKDDCLLPTYNAEQIEKWHQNARKECMEKFKNEGFSE